MQPLAHEASNDDKAMLEGWQPEPWAQPKWRRPSVDELLLQEDVARLLLANLHAALGQALGLVDSQDIARKAGRRGPKGP